MFYRHTNGLAFSFFWLFLIFLLIALILVFEIWMIIDAVKNTRISREERAIWIIGMILLHPLVAIVYYFAASTYKNQNGKNRKK